MGGQDVTMVMLTGISGQQNQLANVDSHLLEGAVGNITTKIFMSCSKFFNLLLLQILSFFAS